MLWMFYQFFIDFSQLHQSLEHFHHSSFTATCNQPLPQPQSELFLVMLDLTSHRDRTQLMGLTGGVMVSWRCVFLLTCAPVAQSSQGMCTLSCLSSTTDTASCTYQVSPPPPSPTTQQCHQCSVVQHPQFPPTVQTLTDSLFSCLVTLFVLCCKPVDYHHVLPSLCLPALMLLCCVYLMQCLHAVHVSQCFFGSRSEVLASLKAF